MSEISKYRHLLTKFCYDEEGNPAVGLDVASQGDPIVPWAFQLDLPPAEFIRYSSGQKPIGIQLYGHAQKLPIADQSLSFLSSSHLLEDFEDWLPVIKEWCRCVKIGGNLIILIPEKDLWDTAIRNGQPPNNSHRHEGRVGELTDIFQRYFGHFEVQEDRLTDLYPGDYTILFVAKRIL